MAMNDTEQYHALRRWLQNSKSNTKGGWLRTVCRKMFDGHLLGRQYLEFPSG